MPLTLDAVQLAYGDTPVLRGLSFALPAGKLGCLLGPSGCGKTSALRAIAGFETPGAGCIEVGGRCVSGPGVHVAPQARGVGMVFQNYALFNHLTVRDNVAFGLRPLDAAARARQVERMLALTGLEDAARRRPHELSGGQRQRVALARALAPQPALLLLDEPFSNLDAGLRQRLSGQVRDILRELGTTALMVTHDQHEAFAIADLVGVMDAGAIEQWAPPVDLYHRPASRFVAGFVGRGVFVRGVAAADGIVQTELGALADYSTARRPPGSALDVLLRPDDLVHDPDSPLTAVVLDTAFRGESMLYTLRLASGVQVLALLPSHQAHAVGEVIGIRPDARGVVTFARSE